MKNLLILGGGYGGLTVAKELAEETIPEDTRIILIDRMPYQGLKTEYYALASGTVAEADIRVRFQFDNGRIEMKYGLITDINLQERFIQLNGVERLDYDTLVIALGCTDKYHGIPGAELHTQSVQSFSATRKAYQEINNVMPYGQISIIGGGLSGVEVASELRESRPDLNIRIIDRGASILSTFPGKLIAYVQDWFNEHDVEMCSHVSLTRIEQNVLYQGNREIRTDVSIWTAGIQPSPLVQKLDVPKDQQGRVLLNERYQIPQHTDVYVIGDCASLPFPPSGQLAETQGKLVAEAIKAEWQGREPVLGKIKLKGVLGALGKNAGFGVMGKKTVMTGRIARVLKSGVLWMSKHHIG